ncbi:Ger(x)C family spore germination protein [Clostridium lundense]|uniref:Ger(x)C family spore germination protein n=1 Tax=Clostridium lundense TaxID=319475 RepID=UPI00068746EA|nr:Ger(x)C family spore germination protein [Clostridium lundense]
MIFQENVMKLKKVILILICCMFTTGCWDKVEIDRRIFVSTIGIDAGQEISKEKELKKLNPNEAFSDNNVKRLNITYGFPDISQLGPQKEGVAEQKSINVDAYSMEDAFTKATAKSSRNISFGHSKLLIMGNNFFGYPEAVKEVLDYLQRQPSLNRNTLVVMAEGKVEDYIKYKPNLEKNTQEYIQGLIENSNRNSSVIPTDLNQFLMNLDENGNSIIPSLTIDKEKNEIKLAGTCLIKNYVFKGILSPTETADIKILRGKFKGGKKVIYEGGHPIDFEIDDMERKITMDSKDNKLTFNINIELEGQIKEYYLGKELLSPQTISKIEDGFNKALKDEMEKVIKVTQNKYSMDLIGFREHVEKYEPKTWNKVKKDWDEIYKNAVINVNVNTHVRRIGAIK